MNTKECEIFKGIKVTDADRADMVPKMSNWSNLSAIAKDWGEETLCKALILELEGKARTGMIQRLLARYNVVRGQRMCREVFSTLA